MGRVAAPEAGTPYHRLARTVRHRWWVPLLAAASVGALWVLAQLFILFGAAVADPAGLTEEGFADPLTGLAVSLLTLAALIPAVLLAARFVQWRPTGTVSSVAGRLRWNWLCLCAAAALPCVAVSLIPPLLSGWLTGAGAIPVGEFVGAREFWVPMAVLLVLVPFQAAGEEYGLRGFVMQAVGSYGRSAGPWPAILVSTAFFTVLHFSYSGWALVDVAVFGLAMGWLTWRTGGLEAGIALHAVHNLVVFTLAAWEGGLDRPETQGSWQALLGTVVEVVLFAAVVLWLARRRSLLRVSPQAPSAGSGGQRRPQG